MDGGPCWASLPPELVRHIADRFLATNDIDYYMDLRAVCRDWRHATDDPTNTWDARFRPCRWIVFRADGSRNSTTYLFVNTATGRFHRKDMPLLSKYHRVAATKGGFLVLVDKIDPAAVYVLNPFTGYLVCFMEPSTTIGITKSAATVFGSPPTLVFLDLCRELHIADLDGEHISVRHENWHLHHRLIWQAIASDVYGLMGCPFSDDPLKMFSSDQIKMFGQHHGFLVESGGEALMVIKHKTGDGMEVFKADPAGRNERVKSIGDDRAIFIGICRCVSVDASKFPSIYGNCIYYVRNAHTYPCNEMIYRYDMKKEKEEMVCTKVVEMIFRYDMKKKEEMVYTEVDTNRGIRITRLLSSYTMTSPYLTTCKWEDLFL